MAVSEAHAGLKASIVDVVCGWQERESRALVLRPRSISKGSGDFNDIDLVQPIDCDEAFVVYVRERLKATYPDVLIELKNVRPFQRKLVIWRQAETVVVDLQDSIILRGILMYRYCELAEDAIERSGFVFVDDIRSDVVILLKELVHVGNLNQKHFWVDEVQPRIRDNIAEYRAKLADALGSKCAARVIDGLLIADRDRLNKMSFDVRRAFLGNRLSAHPQLTICSLVKWAVFGVFRRVGWCE